MENLIKSAQQIKDIIEPIPAERFIVDEFSDNKGNCCFIGHINEALRGDAFADFDGCGARELTHDYLMKHHQEAFNKINEEDFISKSCFNGAEVNNGTRINGYTEPVIKDRLMHLINDMIEAGY